MGTDQVGLKALVAQSDKHTCDGLSIKQLTIEVEGVAMALAIGLARQVVDDPAHAGQFDVAALGDKHDLMAGSGQVWGQMFVLARHILVNENNTHAIARNGNG